MRVQHNARYWHVNMLDICIILLVLLNSGYALITGMTMLCSLLLLLLFVLLVGKVLTQNAGMLRISKRDGKVKLIMIMISTMLICFFLHADMNVIRTYIYTAMIIMDAYLISVVYNPQKILQAFGHLIMYSAIATIIVALLGNVIPFSDYAAVRYNGYDVPYYTIGIVNYQYDLDMRACGLFWEPGMFSGMLTLYCMFDILIRTDKKQNLRILICCVAMYLCYSTAAFFYFIVLVLMMFVRRMKNKMATVSMTAIGIVVVFVAPYIEVMFLRLAELLPIVFEKVVDKNLSYTTRVLSPVADAMIMIRHPFGVGFDHLQSIRYAQHASMGIDSSITTSSLTYYGVCFGVVFLIAYNLCWCGNFWRMKRNICLKVLACVLFAMVFSSNPLHNNLFAWVLLFIEFPTEWDDGEVVRSGDNAYLV